MADFCLVPFALKDALIVTRALQFTLTVPSYRQKENYSWQVAILLPTMELPFDMNPGIAHA